jgi:hypothetical protein
MEHVFGVINAQFQNATHDIWWYVAVFNGILFWRADCRYVKLRNIIQGVVLEEKKTQGTH